MIPRSELLQTAGVEEATDGWVAEPELAYELEEAA
jgi:hypothetical protein